MSWRALSRGRWTLPRVRSGFRRLKTVPATQLIRVEIPVIREVEGKKVRTVEPVDRRKWKAEVIPERDDKIVEVETSPNARPVAEEKAAIREGEASQAEPTTRQLIRLDELRQEREKQRDRDDQEQ